MNLKNVVVFVHGMVPDIEPSDPGRPFELFWEKLRDKGLGEYDKNDAVVARWGHDRGEEDRPLRPDERICRAQAHVSRLVNRKHVRSRPGGNNVLLDRPWCFDITLPPVLELREQIVQHGLADVIYYCSAEGERAVRDAVYGQVLGHLDRFSDADEVRMHVIAHSLGVTVAHDFLFGLFGRYGDGHGPGFVREEQGDESERTQFERWRERAQQGTLTVGSITSMASQLPLMVMRKQRLIDAFYYGKGLDPAQIGLHAINGTNRIKWNIFYDLDDVLGFASRDIYDDPHRLIRQIQVRCGGVVRAHNGYLGNRTVRKETVKLIRANMD